MENHTFLLSTHYRTPKRLTPTVIYAGIMQLYSIQQTFNTWLILTLGCCDNTEAFLEE